jgi:hypothetical protein
MMPDRFEAFYISQAASREPVACRCVSEREASLRLVRFGSARHALSVHIKGGRLSGERYQLACSLHEVTVVEVFALSL